MHSNYLFLPVACNLQYCQTSPNASALLNGQALQPGSWDLDERLRVQQGLSNVAQALSLSLGGNFDIQAYAIQESCRSGLRPDLALTGTCIRQGDGMEVPLHEVSREEQNKLLTSVANIKQLQLSWGMVCCPLADFTTLAGMGSTGRMPRLQLKSQFAQAGTCEGQGVTLAARTPSSTCYHCRAFQKMQCHFSCMRCSAISLA